MNSKHFWTRAHGWTTALKRRLRPKPKALKIIELPRKTRLVASGCCRARDLSDVMAATIERARKMPLKVRGEGKNEEGAATPGAIIP